MEFSLKSAAEDKTRWARVFCEEEGEMSTLIWKVALDMQTAFPVGNRLVNHAVGEIRPLN